MAEAVPGDNVPLTVAGPLMVPLPVTTPAPLTVKVPVPPTVLPVASAKVELSFTAQLIAPLMPLACKVLRAPAW